jgi:hypothetical protein
MIKQQMKSSCCNAAIIHFGGRRRQCTGCKKTWRIRLAKRGRKVKRLQTNYLKQVFDKGLLVKQIDTNSRISIDAVYKRFSINLSKLTIKKRIVRIRGSKLILLIDAQWHYFDRKLWTLYFVAIKSSDEQNVILLDPVLRSGKENSSEWNQVFDNLPQGIKKRVVAVVSDGVRGIELLVSAHGWIHQRCHFHLLKRLQSMRGKRLSTTGRLTREEIYRLAKVALSEPSKTKLNIVCQELLFLAKDVYCPIRMKMVVREFIRRLAEFRSYLDYPDLNIPTTTNVMESVNSYTQKRSKTVKTPKAWHEWAIASVRFKSKFICK